MGCSKSGFKREVHSSIDTVQRKNLKQSNFKELDKELRKPWVNRKKEIFKNSEEIHKIEIFKKSIKLSWVFEKINKVHKSLAKLPKKSWNKTINEEVKTNNTTEVQRAIVL